MQNSTTIPNQAKPNTTHDPNLAKPDAARDPAFEGLALIACVSQDRGLGKDGKLLWSIPEDMKFFRETTTGGTVIMGRKTYESIGRPLPKRENIILSRSGINSQAGQCGSSANNQAGQHSQNTTNPTPNTTLKFFSDQSALDQHLATVRTPKFIIGGATLYNIYINLADKLYLTEVQASKPADTYFPDFDKSLFLRKVLKSGEHVEHTSDGDQTIKYEIVEYIRKPATKQRPKKG